MAIAARAKAFAEAGPPVAIPGLPMHKHVEILLGRLATDRRLRARFAAAPETLLRELSAGGLELTETELEALVALRPAALVEFAAALDARLRKASLAAPAAPARDDHPSASDPEPESQP
jgi:hypothetical protein